MPQGNQSSPENADDAPAQDRRPLKLGLFRGQIQMTDDFDEGMQIKRQLGKLDHSPITDQVVRANLDQNNIELLPIKLGCELARNLERAVARLAETLDAPFDSAAYGRVAARACAVVRSSGQVSRNASRVSSITARETSRVMNTSLER